MSNYTRINPEYQTKGDYPTRLGGSTCTHAGFGTNAGYDGQLVRFEVMNRGKLYTIAITRTAIELYEDNTRLWSK